MQARGFRANHSWVTAHAAPGESRPYPCNAAHRLAAAAALGIDVPVRLAADPARAAAYGCGANAKYDHAFFSRYNDAFVGYGGTKEGRRQGL